MIEDDTRILRNKLDEKTSDIQKITNTQLEIMINDVGISTLEMQNKQLQNELKVDKEITERMNKSSEVVRYFEDLLKSPRSTNDTSILGYEKRGEYSSNEGK